MAMVVQHNLTTMNSNRMLGVTNSAQAKSTEKLSSGYKINRAADDAAGLTISEKMRKQIRGLSRASTNAQDGVSAVQTAEGALTEVHSMLQRMNELAVQASNGTNSESDRQALQDEIDQLVTEIDRVSETTKFNETYLLKGNQEGNESAMKVNAHDAGLKGKLTDNGNGTATFELKLKDGDKVNIGGVEYAIGSGAAKADLTSYGMYTTTIQGTQLKAGDSITYMDGTAEKTVTMANKFSLTTDGTTAIDKTKLASGAEFEVTDEGGTKMTYVVGTTALADTKITDTNDKILARLQEALKAGHTVVMTKSAVDGTTACKVNVVSKLEAGEIGYATWVGTNSKTVNGLLTHADGLGKTGVTPKSVTLDGKTTNITSKTPKSYADVAAVIGQLQNGDKVKINSGADFIVASETDTANNKYTVQDLLKKINDADGDIDTVEFSISAGNTQAQKLLTASGITNTAQTGTMDGTNAVSVVGRAPSGSTNTISVSEAYNKITTELTKASSIGTDKGSEAKVQNSGSGIFTITKGSAMVKDALNFNLHVGADADMTNKINVNIDAMSAAGLGIKGLDVKGTGNDNGIAATYAVDAIADAVAKVSAQRSALGAVQNRLEHTIANLDNIVENTTSAESRIRDTDMAKEMVEYSKNNILAQAGTSMLAQANQSNQSILSLLQ